MPPVAANIQGAVLCADPIASPTSTPSRQRNEEIKLQIIACLIVIPAFKSTAKSPRVIIKRIKIKNYLLDFFFVPSSWGSSWHKTAIAVVKPPVMEAAKAAPMARPSDKLCNPSPASTSHARDDTP